MRFSGNLERPLKMIVEFFEAALFDLKSSKEYYSKIEIDLGDHFLKDIESALNDIKTHPKASSQHHKFSHLRLKHCRRFPFTIIYHHMLGANTIYIVAVAHQKRTPNYWTDRI